MAYFKEYTLVFFQNDIPIGSGFIVSGDGLVATCHHVLVDLLEAGEDSPVGKHFILKDLDRAVQMNAVCMASDEIHDTALLKLDGPIPTGMQPACLISSKVLLKGYYHFSVTAYGEVEENPNHGDYTYDYISAGGPVIGFHGRTKKDIPVEMIQIEGGILKGMSGAPVTLKSLTGVVGMISGRYNDLYGWLERNGWVVRIEDLVSLAEQNQLSIPEPESCHGLQAIIAGGRIGVVDSQGNALVQVLIPEHWKRPHSCDPLRRWNQMVGREQQLEEIRERFAKTDNPGGTYLAIHGLPGMGKSTLAANYAYLDGTEKNYPGGVLWTNAAVDDAQQIFTQWAREAYKEDQWPGIQTNSRQKVFEAGAIRKMLDGHGPLLVILDDAQSSAVIEHLRDALPFEADVLLTTRDGTLASQFMGNTGFPSVELESLSEKDAVTLLQISQSDLQPDELLPLVAAVGAHPQTLGIIAAQLRQFSTRERCEKYLQSLLEKIRYGEGTDLSKNFDMAFSYLYVLITDEDPQEQAQHQQWLRYLGILVPTEADFSTEMASVLWDTDTDTAAAYLERLSRYSIVHPTLEGRWSQNMMVRSALRQKLIEQPEERELALQAYLRYVLEIVFQTQNLIQDNQGMIADLPHIYYIGDEYARELEETLGNDLAKMSVTDILRYQVDSKAVAEELEEDRHGGVDVLQAFFQQITPYLIHFSLDNTLMHRWLAAGYITGLLMDSIDGQIAILIYWSRWLSSQERVEEAGQVLEQIIAIADSGNGGIDVRMWAISEKADLLRISGNMQGAVSALQECEELFKQHGSIVPFAYGNLYHNFGLVYFFALEWQKALDYFNRAYGYLTHDEESLQRLELVQFIALCYGRLGRYEEALLFFEKIEKYFDSPAIVSIKPTLLRIRGGIHTRNGELDLAEGDLLQAMKAAENTGQVSILIAVQNQLAEIKMSQGLFDDALTCLKDARHFLQYAPDKTLETTISGNLGIVYYSLGNLERALDFLKKSIGMLRDLHDPPALTEEFVVTGKIFQATKQIREGLDFFHGAKNVVRELRLYSSEIAIIESIAQLHFEDGNPQRALQLFEEVLPRVKSIADPEERGTVLMKMSELYISMGQMDESLDTLKEALMIWEKLSNIHLKTQTLLDLSYLYYLRRDLKQFHNTFEQCEKMLPSQTKGYQKQFHQIRGMMRFEQQDYKEALKDFQESAEISNQTGDLEEYISNLVLIASSYFRMDDLKAARWELQKALKRVENTNQPELQAFVQATLGILYFGEGNQERGKELLQSGLGLLDQRSLNLEAGGPVFEVLCHYQDIFPYLDVNSRKSDQSPTDALRVFLRTSNWLLLEQLSNLLFLQLPTIVSSLQQQLTTVKDDKTLVKVLRLYRQLFERAQQESISTAISEARNDFEHPEMYHWRGRVMLDHRLYAAALTQLNRAIGMDGKQASFYVDRGWALRGLGSYSVAMENFTQAIDLEPNLAEGYLGRGVAFFERNRTPDALKDLAHAIKLNERSAISYQWRGSLSLCMGDTPSALDDLNKAVDLEPTNQEHLYWRGLVKLRSKDYIGAIEDLAKACAQDIPDSMGQAYVFLWRGLAHQQNEESGYAKSYWELADNIADKLVNPIQSNLVKGLYYVMSNQRKLADEAYDAVTKLHFIPHVLIGQIHHLDLLAAILNTRWDDIKKMILKLKDQISLKTG